MSVPLPSGWADTGVTRSFSISGNISLGAGPPPTFWFQNRVDMSPRGMTSPASQWHMWVYVHNTENPPVYHWYGDIHLLYGTPFLQSDLTDPTYGPVIESVDLGTNPVPDESQFSTPISFTATLGPYRLGARYGLWGSEATGAPLFAEYFQLECGWFADEATTYAEAFADQSLSFSPVIAGGTPVKIDGWIARQYLQWAANASSDAAIALKFRDYIINAARMDTTGLPHEQGSGDWDVTGAGTNNIQFAPGGSVTLGCEILDYSGATVSGAHVRDNWLTVPQYLGGVPAEPQEDWVPATPTEYVIDWCTSWNRLQKSLPDYIDLTLDNGWILANGWDPDDFYVVQDLCSPLTGATTYTPIRVAHAASIEIDRPTGDRPSHWLAGIGGSISEESAATVFTVTTAGGIFTRDFASNWRQYVTSGNPDYRAWGARILKRHYLGSGQTVYPEDIWWWNGYGFLKATVDASTSATMTLIVEGIRLQTTGGSNQWFETRTYRIALTSGSHDYWIDLGFPDSSNSQSHAPYPMERPRVDRLTVEFSATGTFTLQSLALSRRDSYPPEIAITYPPLSHYPADFGSVYIRVDGEATPVLSIPDSANKGVECETGYGGAPRVWDPAGGGYETRLVSQLWTDIDRVEGFTITYDGSAGDAYLMDAYDVRLGPEYGFWCVESAPGAAFAGGQIDLVHRIRAGRLTLTNGMASTVVALGRKILGGGIETVAMQDGKRAGSGVSMECRAELNALLGTGTTDARGRVAFAPIGYAKQAQFVQAP